MNGFDGKTVKVVCLSSKRLPEPAFNVVCSRSTTHLSLKREGKKSRRDVNGNTDSRLESIAVPDGIKTEILGVILLP